MAAYLRQICPLTTANLELPNNERLLRTLEMGFEAAERDAKRCLNCPGLACTEEEIRDGKCDGTKTVIKMEDDHLYAAFDRCEKLRTWQRQQELERNIKSAQIPKRFTKVTFETLRLDNHNRQAYLAAKKYAEEFTRDTSDGLIIAGPVGTGKTHLAIAILRTVLQKGIPGICVQVPELLYEIRQSFGYENADKANLLNLVKTAEFLVLDDLGAEKATDWVRETIFVVIDARYRDLKPMVITTNCTLDELAERIGDRIASRIVEMCQGIYLGGKDWRLGKRDK